MIGLEYLCSLNNISYSELAKRMNISRQTVTNWIAGRRNINEKYYEDLKDIFGIAPEWIVKEINNIDRIKIQDILLQTSLEESSKKSRSEIITKDVVNKSVRDYRIAKQELVENLIDYFEKVYINAYEEYEDDFDAALTAKSVVDIFSTILKVLDKKYIHRGTVQTIVYALEVANNPDIDEDNLNKKMKLFKAMIEAEEEITSCEMFALGANWE
ncbi:helix-turn-helix domain-containing protein [Clostridium perfringens]|uniref:helix-turn-helix domain-containing protein n=1 Tax=Clostridium perfringens TaxID=1502 RepID=UPI000D7097DC|nr:helix-turn-helix transcriptional regulator [Clostridium perfringens]EJT6665769.1 helix-turn-helix transcriptional regulator [Clostridium perfringens]MBI6007179.1 helix-turn-helix transcriptional regulator [Clostridium perfringens]MBO3338935.1 helix-turn-helix transcriptional regulator [Clostridium perfringens]MBO3421371.1 helix-turn-helix transcriptional regulator [Clostridium perfringens]MBO3427756.1 helix-turn-helix transcriptional regulator [Clostridium perfringens]